MLFLIVILILFASALFVCAAFGLNKLYTDFHNDVKRYYDKT